VLLFADILLLVKSPVTTDGVITSATPLPLETFTVTSGMLLMPPLKTPVLSLIAHCAVPVLALKLPLLCANARLPTNKVASVALANTASSFLIVVSPHRLVPLPPLDQSLGLLLALAARYVFYNNVRCSLYYSLVKQMSIAC
jgi:hypothetical protein